MDNNLTIKDLKPGNIYHQEYTAVNIPFHQIFRFDELAGGKNPIKYFSNIYGKPDDLENGIFIFKSVVALNNNLRLATEKEKKLLIQREEEYFRNNDILKPCPN